MTAWGARRRCALDARVGVGRLLAFALMAAACAPVTDDLARIEGYAQGTTYGVQWVPAVGADERAVAAAVADELDRLDQMLSNYRADSAVEQFNAAQTTEPLEAPAELLALLRAATAVGEASGGCFDPTVRPLVALWGFDGPEPRVPAAADLEAVRRTVGIEHLAIESDTRVAKRVPGLAVDVSGIAQGYTADRLAAVLEGLGVERYLVEIGGEIVARGRKPDGERWRVAIETPDGSAAGTALRVLALPERRSAVATSGTYERFFVASGRRYPHVLDPRTGSPVEHALVSVTVLHADAALADAWSTALLCLGPDDARTVAEREQIAALLSIERGSGVEEWSSPSLAAEWGDTLAPVR